MAIDGQLTPGFPNEKAKPRKTPKSQSLTKQCDALFGQLVRSLGYCQNCGSTQNLQCAHGFSRRYRATRWNFRNAWCLCQGCHLKYTMRPLEWDEWMREKLGDDYELLRAVALMGRPPKLEEQLLVLRSVESNVGDRVV